MITGLDFVGIASRDAARSRAFYVDTLGLRPDDTSQYEFWIGETCFAIWEPEKMGREFVANTASYPALHVDDIEAARADLEARGVRFIGDTFDTGVCLMAFFADPDGNSLMLHHRNAPR